MSRLITIRVGKPAKAYLVHEAVLCSSSKALKEAVREQFQEKSRVIKLPNVNANEFNKYLNWLWRHQLFIIENDTEEVKQPKTITRLMNLYLLGDQLKDIDFKDSIADALITTIYDSETEHKWVPDSVDIQLMYDKSAKGSAIRRLIVAVYSHSQSIITIKEEDEDKVEDIVSGIECVEFLTDLSRALMHGKGESPKSAAVKCAYHEHEKGAANCYRDKYY